MPDRVPLTEDPRWIAHRDAYTAAQRPDAAGEARERYARSQAPYAELLAEQCDPHVRPHMMRSLIAGGMPQETVGAAFKATEEEMRSVS